MALSRPLVNVILLGLAFHLIFFSFQTSVFIQQTVVNSIKTKPEYHFHGDGYISLCLTYTVFALSNWLAPSLIALCGLKLGMFLGATTYALYSASFLYPTTLLFYTAAALIGLGAGPLWTAQGSFLAQNSSPETSSRNSGLFWSMLQASMLFGNAFVYYAFSNQETISDGTRYVVYAVLTLVCLAGLSVILLLHESSSSDTTNQDSHQQQVTAWSQFLGAIRLAKTRDMLVLASAFLFTGQLLSFFTGIFGTAIGATGQFGISAKKYIGLSGICIGVGEIISGAIFGLLGPKVQSKGGLSRDKVFLLGYLVLIVALSLVFVTLPPDASLVPYTMSEAIIAPRIWLVMLSSVLIGFGDACFNTQIYALLITMYKGNTSVAAFALFKFVQSIGSAIAFLYSTALDLRYQLSLIFLLGSIATVTFCLTDLRFCHNQAKTGSAKVASAAAEAAGRSQSQLNEPNQRAQQPAVAV